MFYIDLKIEFERRWNVDSGWREANRGRANRCRFDNRDFVEAFARTTIEGMDSNCCNAETTTGDRCNLPADTCENSEHRQRRRLSVAWLREVFANRDTRSVAWYWLEALSMKFDAKNATSAASFARLIHALGDSPADEAEALAEAALFGGIMHGIPPRDAAQWAIVERTFDPQTVKDLRRWRPNPFTLGPDEDPASMPQSRRMEDKPWEEWEDDPADDD